MECTGAIMSPKYPEILSILSGFLKEDGLSLNPLSSHCSYSRPLFLIPPTLPAPAPLPTPTPVHAPVPRSCSRALLLASRPPYSLVIPLLAPLVPAAVVNIPNIVGTGHYGGGRYGGGHYGGGRYGGNLQKGGHYGGSILPYNQYIFLIYIDTVQC